MLEGRVVIRDCGCWRVSSYSDPPLVLRSYRCRRHGEEVLDFLEHQLYLDKVDSVSALEGEGEQLWLT